MSEDLRAENERLKASNARLANHIVSIGETLEASRRELLATGWDAGMTRGQELAAWAIGNRPDSVRSPTRATRTDSASRTSRAGLSFANREATPDAR